MMAEAKSKESKKTFYLVLIVILIILNIFFAYNHWTAHELSEQYKTERNELDTLYNGALAELDLQQISLDSLKGANGELDSLLTERQRELDETRQEIETLLAQAKLNEKQLKDARWLIKSLKKENKRYQSQIDTLSKQVIFLTSLSDSLTEGLTSEMLANNELRSEREILSQKAALGSLLKPQGVEGSGIRMKSDREVPTNSAKKSSKLRVCFDVPKNRVADPGEKTLFLQIQNPQGATIAIETQGSGVFETAENGEEKQYTTKASFDYQGQQKRVCVYWSQTAAYGKGSYKVRFYQDGYFLGENEFTLK